MICIADAGVFTDHAAFADAYPSHGYDVCAARNDEPIAKFDPSISLGFQMDVGVQQHILADMDATGSVDGDLTQDDDRGRQLFAQIRRKKSMGVDPFGSLSQRSRDVQKPRE